MELTAYLTVHFLLAYALVALAWVLACRAYVTHTLPVCLLPATHPVDPCSSTRAYVPSLGAMRAATYLELHDEAWALSCVQEVSTCVASGGVCSLRLVEAGEVVAVKGGDVEMGVAERRR